MRDVRSKNYYEQMLGRGCRTLGYDDLARVSPSAKSNKYVYAVVDCVGVTKSMKTDSRPLERKPTVSMHDLMMSVVMGARDDDTVTSLANRLLRLNAVMDADEQKKAKELAGGVAINSMAKAMLDAFDEDVIAKLAESKAMSPDEAQAELVERAVESIQFAELRNHLENVRKAHDQLIDNVNLDTVVFSGWDDDREEEAERTLSVFRGFLEDNKDELEALQNGPYGLNADKVWHSCEVLGAPCVMRRDAVGKLMDIISIIRYEIGGTVNSFAQIQPAVSMTAP